MDKAANQSQTSTVLKETLWVEACFKKAESCSNF